MTTNDHCLQSITKAKELHDKWAQASSLCLICRKRALLICDNKDMLQYDCAIITRRENAFRDVVTRIFEYCRLSSESAPDNECIRILDHINNSISHLCTTKQHADVWSLESSMEQFLCAEAIGATHRQDSPLKSKLTVVLDSVRKAACLGLSGILRLAPLAATLHQQVYNAAGEILIAV